MRADETHRATLAYNALTFSGWRRMCLRVNKSERPCVPEEGAMAGDNPGARGGVLAMREPPGYLGTIVRRMKLHAGAGAVETA